MARLIIPPRTMETVAAGNADGNFLSRNHAKKKKPAGMNPKMLTATSFTTYFPHIGGMIS